MSQTLTRKRRAELDIASHGGRLVLVLLSRRADKGEEVTTGASDVQTRCLGNPAMPAARLSEAGAADLRQLAFLRRPLE